VRLTLGGYAGLTLGWVEGIEVGLLGAVAGIDLRRPAVKLPGLGRLGTGGPDGPPAPVPRSVGSGTGESQAGEVPRAG
jgi:hypothetical protein